MGSIEIPATTKATFQIPVYNEADIKSPWTRSYNTPPKFYKTINRSYPLASFREEVGLNNGIFNTTAQAHEFMTKYGFTAFRSPTALLQPPYGPEAFTDFNKMEEIYYPETKELVKKVTGCKRVMITHSVLRGGNVDPDYFPVPSGDLQNGGKNYKLDVKDGTKQSEPDFDYARPLHRSSGGKPLRNPHNDVTPLGLRRMVRQRDSATYRIAEEAGIIASENQICSQHGMKATDEASDAVLAIYYNVGGRVGPRYAAFSIWRPLKTVTRNPLALTPRPPLEAAQHSMSIFPWKYENKVMGQHGDWLGQWELLRVEAGQDLPTDTDEDDVKYKSRPTWYWLPEQDPEEVLFVLLSDSAGLGDGPVAGGCFHASPDIGKAAYGDDRESCEVRCIAFW